MNFHALFSGLLLLTSSCLFAQLRPAALKAGDTIAIIATARSVSGADVQPAVDWAKSNGFHVILGRSIAKVENQLAGADWLRATDLQNQINNPSVKMIWTAKGGYGTVKILDRVDFSPLQKRPKWIVGFSDVTALHQHLQKKGLSSLHGPVAISIKNAPEDVKTNLLRTLKGGQPIYTIPSHPFNQSGVAQGKLIGGNLSVLYSLVGSPSMVDSQGCILYLEDLDEYLYHIDRMLMNLKRNGYFANLKGVVVGSFTKMRDNEVPWGMQAYEILQSYFKELNIPVIYDFPAGHIRNNQPLILGEKVKIEVSSTRANLTYL